jgi:hypothetical protein
MGRLLPRYGLCSGRCSKSSTSSSSAQYGRMRILTKSKRSCFVHWPQILSWHVSLRCSRTTRWTSSRFFRARPVRNERAMFFSTSVTAAARSASYASSITSARMGLPAKMGFFSAGTVNFAAWSARTSAFSWSKRSTMNIAIQISYKVRTDLLLPGYPLARASGW